MSTATLVPHIPMSHALALGFVQGATEFLPVSSTAHMRILPVILNWQDPGTAFSAIVQLGPIIAIIAYFRHDLVRYIAGIRRSFKKGLMFPKGDIDARLGWYTVLATIPLIIGGLLLEHEINHRFRDLRIDATVLIVLGLILLVAERVGTRTRTLESLTLKEAMYIGVAQVLAVIPGASRSGCTITMGLFQGLDREAAARFSFLLSIPAITLAGLYELYSKVIHKHASLHGVTGPYLAATALAGVVAYVIIRWLLGYLENEQNTTIPFVVYRIMLGLGIFYLLHAGYVFPQSY